MNSNKDNSIPKDYSLIAFLLPLVGFIMAAYQLKQKANDKAKKLVYWSLGGVAFNVICYLIFK